MRTLVVGDIHGAYKALVQALERANFDPAADQLIGLGDVADGWPEVKQCVDLLLRYKAICVMGNHDEWFLDYLRTGVLQPIWTSQGGRATLESYAGGIPESHDKFFRSLMPFVHDEDKDFVYIHAGWEPQGLSVRDVHVTDDMWWLREFWYKAKVMAMLGKNLTPHSRVFIGHTAYDNGPHKHGEVWNLDSGAGWSGKLTVMDADTEEYWQSDCVLDLYPWVQGRR